VQFFVHLPRLSWEYKWWNFFGSLNLLTSFKLSPDKPHVPFQAIYFTLDRTNGRTTFQNLMNKTNKRAILPPWSSSVAGDTTISLRFPFQQKARSFFITLNYSTSKDGLAFCWMGKRNGSVIPPSTKELHASTIVWFCRCNGIDYDHWASLPSTISFKTLWPRELSQEQSELSLNEMSSNRRWLLKVSKLNSKCHYANVCLNMNSDLKRQTVL